MGRREMTEMKNNFLCIGIPPSKHGDCSRVWISTIILLQRWGKSKKNYLHFWRSPEIFEQERVRELPYLGPAIRMTMVHPKRIIKKIINCLTNLGSISPPLLLKAGDEPCCMSWVHTG
jgi:hypothetical protein